ncbi:type II secretion system F family protein [Nocardioides nanhaiensis]|uniref:Type II secretion system F family protein n=1 Tax=Nocardioides nanhaiensis TaxID=1476871 RepID=A0ABP8WZZ9_9ACTN
MGAVVGLGVGIGLMLIWSAFALPRHAAATGQPRDGRLVRLLATAGSPGVTPTGFLGLCAASGVGAGLVVLVLTQTPPIALVMGAMAGYLPVGVMQGRARRRRRELAEVWPEAVDNLASAVRAGLSLPDALAGLAVRGPAPLRASFEAFALDYQATGRFSDCLDRLKDRLADPTGDRVVEGLRVAREVGGGDLGRLLRNLSGYLRDDLRTRSELESRQAWAVNGARLAVAAPWVVLLLMSGRQDVIGRYRSVTGVVILLIGAAACLGAYRLMMRLGRLPTEKRVFAGVRS